MKPPKDCGRCFDTGIVRHSETVLCYCKAGRKRRAGKKEATEYDPDSIMGIMSNIKRLSDEIKGGE